MVGTVGITPRRVLPSRVAVLVGVVCLLTLVVAPATAGAATIESAAAIAGRPGPEPQSPKAQGPGLPMVEHYGLDVAFLPGDGEIEATAWMRVRNGTDRPWSTIPFLLHRLLEVEAVTGAGGEALEFDQKVVTDTDRPKLQVNLVEVDLAEPLAPGATTTVGLEYGGPIVGYREVYAYVRDTISEDYSLLRLDTFAYPLLARPSARSRHAASGPSHRYTYDLRATAPGGLTVATGGRLLEVIEESGSGMARSRGREGIGPGDTDKADPGDAGEAGPGGRRTFVFESKVPVWRIDVAAAPFSVVKDEDEELYVYVLPGHEEGAARVLQAMRDAVGLYTRMFGEVGDFAGYTAIEIPDGWGSQAGDLYFLQTAAAFEDPERIGEVYHEVAHGWNAQPASDVARCRYFDEAFASYFETLAQRELHGPEAFAEDLEQSREIFGRWVDAGRQYADTPIAEYGLHEMGGLSYTKGALSLHVLSLLVGEEDFRRIVRRLLEEHLERPADFDDFQRIAEEVAGPVVRPFFREWIHQGPESSRLLLEGVSFEEIAARYR